jgi:hypothetical protein
MDRKKNLENCKFLDLSELVTRWNPSSYLPRRIADPIKTLIEFGTMEIEWSCIKRKWYVIPLDQKNDGPQNIGTKEFFEMEKKIQDLENQLKQNCGAINESEELKKWKEAYAQLDQSKTEMMEFKDNAIESLKKELKQEAENYIRVLTKEKDDVIENLKIQLTDMTEEKDRFLKRAKFLEDKYEPEKI